MLTTKLLIEKELIEKIRKMLSFFAANTVATIDFAKKYNGHGWVN